MATFDWKIPAGSTGDFASSNSWFKEPNNSSPGIPGINDDVSLAGAASNANGDILVTLANNEHKAIHNLSIFQPSSGSKPAKISIGQNSDLTVTGTLSFQTEISNPNNTAHLEIVAGTFILAGNAGVSGPIDSIAIGGSALPPSPNNPTIFVDDAARFEVAGGSLVTNSLQINGFGGFDVTSGGSATVGGSLFINQQTNANWITVSGTNNSNTGSLLEIVASGTGAGDLNLDGRLMVSLGGIVEAHDVTIGSHSFSSLQVGTYPSSTATSTLTATRDMVVGDDNGDAAFLVAAPNGQIVVKRTLTLLDDVTDTQHFSGEVTTEGGSIEIGGITGAAPNSIQIDGPGTLIGHGYVNTPALANDGLFEAQGGLLLLSGSLTGGGITRVDADGILEIGGSVSGFSGQVQFQGSGGTLVLDQPLNFGNSATISGLAVSDTIQLNNTGSALSNAVTSAQITNSGQSLVISEGSTSVTYNVQGATGLDGYQVLFTESSDHKVTSLTLVAPVVTVIHQLDDNGIEFREVKYGTTGGTTNDLYLKNGDLVDQSEDQGHGFTYELWDLSDYQLKQLKIDVGSKTIINLTYDQLAPLQVAFPQFTQNALVALNDILSGSHNALWYLARGNSFTENIVDKIGSFFNIQIVEGALASSSMQQLLSLGGAASGFGSGEAALTSAAVAQTALTFKDEKFFDAVHKDKLIAWNGTFSDGSMLSMGDQFNDGVETYNVEFKDAQGRESFALGVSADVAIQDMNTIIKILTTPLSNAPPTQVASNAPPAQVSSGGQLIMNPFSGLITFVNGVPVISNDGGSVISNDGGSVISNDGGSIISDNSEGLISTDYAGLAAMAASNVFSKAASLVSNSGGTLVGNAGGTLVGNAGGTLISPSYLANAVVFADSNFDGKLDNGEMWTITDSKGQFSLSGAWGPLVAIGGVDTGTHLAYDGFLSAPLGATTVSSLTTLAEGLSKPTGDIDGSISKLQVALGISADVDLTMVDPVAGTENGDANSAKIYVESAKVMDTVALITGAFAGHGASALVTGSQAPGANVLTEGQDIFAGMVDLIAQNDVMNLSDQGTVTSLINSVAGTLGIDASGFVGSLSANIAASNQSLDQLLITDGSGPKLANDILAVEIAAQGTSNLTVSSMSATTDTGASLVNAGHLVSITVKLSEIATVIGTPTLQLNDGQVAAYTIGSGTDTLLFTYAVQAGDSTADLKVTGLNLPGAANIVDESHNGLAGPVSSDLGISVDNTVVPTTVQTELMGLYAALYNRAGEAGGYGFWVSQVAAQADAAGLTVANSASTSITQHDALLLGQGFVISQSTFFNATYGSLTDGEFINAMYVNIGGNAGDPGGINFWSGLLQSGESAGQSVQDARAGLVGQFVQILSGFDTNNRPAGLTDQQWNDAVLRTQTIDNKIATSIGYFIASEQPSGALLNPAAVNDDAYLAAIRAIEGVTSDPLTAEQAISNIAQAVAAHDLNLIQPVGVTQGSIIG